MESWLCSPIHESCLGQDLAIRRFCPARVEEQEHVQGGGGGELSWEEALLIMPNEIELSWSPMDSSSTPPPLTTPTSEEEEEFVDSIFNTECYDKNNNISFFPDHQNHDDSVLIDHFQLDELENFSLMLDYDDIYGDDIIPMLIEGEGDDLSPSPNLLLFDSQTTSSECDSVDCASQQMLPVSGGEEASSTSSHGVDQGLHLVHLLLACAEAVGCRDTQLAASMLSQIWPYASPWGDSLQRVSYCFATGLNSRLSLLHNLNANGTFGTKSFTDGSNPISREEKTEALQLLHQTTPYVAFGFLAANDAICQAAQGKDALHIIDLGMDQHTLLQWSALIRALSARPGGPPKSVRITGIVGSENDHENFTELQATNNIKHLVDEAGSLGIPLEFLIIAEQATASLLTRENLNLREGEALFVNSIMHLHKYVKESRGSLKTILQAIKKLRPTLLTVVEQDANHNGPFFLGRFLESLHYYSAIFDSLEASLPRNSPERIKIEKIHFAEEIKNIVACEGSDRIERHERADQWRRQLGRAGFQAVGLKSMSQARMMLSVYGCDGYTLASDKGCLLLGWKGRPIMLASAWQVHFDPKVSS